MTTENPFKLNADEFEEMMRGLQDDIRRITRDHEERMNGQRTCFYRAAIISEIKRYAWEADYLCGMTEAGPYMTADWIFNRLKSQKQLRDFMQKVTGNRKLPVIYFSGHIRARLKPEYE